MGSLGEAVRKVFIFSTCKSIGWSGNNKHSTSMKNVQPDKFQPFVVERNLEFNVFTLWHYLHFVALKQQYTIKQNLNKCNVFKIRENSMHVAIRRENFT